MCRRPERISRGQTRDCAVQIQGDACVRRCHPQRGSPVFIHHLQLAVGYSPALAVEAPCHEDRTIAQTARSDLLTGPAGARQAGPRTAARAD